MEDKISIQDLSDLLFYVCPNDQLVSYQKEDKNPEINNSESKKVI